MNLMAVVFVINLFRVYHLLFRIFNNVYSIDTLDHNLIPILEAIFDAETPLLCLFCIAPHQTIELLSHSSASLFCKTLLTPRVPFVHPSQQQYQYPYFSQNSRYEWPLAQLSDQSLVLIENQYFDYLPSIYKTYIKEFDTNFNSETRTINVDSVCFYFLHFIQFPINLNNSLLNYELSEVLQILKERKGNLASKIGIETEKRKQSKTERKKAAAISNNNSKKDLQFTNPFLLKNYPKFVSFPNEKESYFYFYDNLLLKQSQRNGTNALVGAISSLFFNSKQKSETTRQNKQRRELTQLLTKSFVFESNQSNLFGFYQFLFADYCNAFIPLPRTLYVLMYFTFFFCFFFSLQNVFL